MTRRIFISYAREDASIVKEMAKDLRSRGHTVWMDRNLVGGEDWWSEILFQIEECDLFVYAISDAALFSENCSNEYGYAADRMRPIIPVRVRSLHQTRRLKKKLKRTQILRYREDDKGASFELLKAVDRLAAEVDFDEIVDKPDRPAAPSFKKSTKLRVEVKRMNKRLLTLHVSDRGYRGLITFKKFWWQYDLPDVRVRVDGTRWPVIIRHGSGDVQLWLPNGRELRVYLDIDEDDGLEGVEASSNGKKIEVIK